MNPEPKHEFSEFELQLRKLTPNGSSLSPEATFYRAGFEAACQQNSLASVTTSNTKSQSRFGLGMFVGVAASMLTMLTMQSLVSSTTLNTPPTIAKNNVETSPGSVAEPGDLKKKVRTRNSPKSNPHRETCGLPFDRCQRCWDYRRHRPIWTNLSTSLSRHAHGSVFWPRHIGSRSKKTFANLVPRQYPIHRSGQLQPIHKSSLLRSIAFRHLNNCDSKASSNPPLTRRVSEEPLTRRVSEEH